jgi:hypothetical protein
MNKPTEFETMRVLHYLWSNKHITAFDVKHLLLVEYNLKLSTLTNGGISAEDIEQKTKYKLT